MNCSDRSDVSGYYKVAIRAQSMKRQRYNMHPVLYEESKLAHFESLKELKITFNYFINYFQRRHMFALKIDQVIDMDKHVTRVDVSHCQRP